jgi:uncharacterized Zn finger protein
MKEGIPMNCPICGKISGVEIDLHSEGYADDLFECADCSTLWTSRFGEVKLLNNKVA